MKTRKNTIQKRKTRRKINALKIPIIVICWNELTYIRNMVNQLKHFNHPIILLDNHSTFAPLLEYYKEIKRELGSKIEIRMLKKNYGNTVYLRLQHTLPRIYMLTDPDIELNKHMPENFCEILLNLSEKYKMYKIGMALDTKHKEKFLNCGSPNSSKKLFNYHAQFFKNKIKDDTYELYNAFVDTTFCLVNTKYAIKHYDISKDYMQSTKPALRIAGNFTAKHLPWYKNSLKKMPKNELNAYMKNSKSSTIVRNCIIPMMKKKDED
jgi:hypothetical protein